jgi:hypothetical protein
MLGFIALGLLTFEPAARRCVWKIYAENGRQLGYHWSSSQSDNSTMSTSKFPLCLILRRPQFQFYFHEGLEVTSVYTGSGSTRLGSAKLREYIGRLLLLKSCPQRVFAVMDSWATFASKAELFIDNSCTRLPMISHRYYEDVIYYQPKNHTHHSPPHQPSLPVGPGLLENQ